MTKSKKKVIGIVGSRKRNEASDYWAIHNQFFEIYNEGDYICSGGCEKGGDKFAEVIAKREGIPIITYYPNTRKGVPACYFLRNTEIAKRSHVLIACVSSDRKGGTEDTIKKFKKLHPEGEVYLV